MSQAGHSPATARHSIHRCSVRYRKRWMSIMTPALSTFRGPRTRVRWAALCLVSALLAACDAASVEVPKASTPRAVGDAQGAPPPAAAVARPSAGAIQAAVDDVLQQAYGVDQYDPSRGCWRHVLALGGESRSYCLEAGEPQVIDTTAGTQVHLQTRSDPAAGLYASADPGVRGLFAIAIERDGQYRLIASSPSLTSGQAGDCTCAESRLVEVGPQRYGWLGLDGGIWQGVEVSYHTLYVIDGAAFKDVASIPRRTEDAQSDHTELDFDRDGTPVAGMYPLVVTHYSGDALEARQLIRFDSVRKVYPWTP